jgi:hypothetical protein
LRRPQTHDVAGCIVCIVKNRTSAVDVARFAVIADWQVLVAGHAEKALLLRVDANASIHSRGSDPFSESTVVPSLIGPLPASIAYKRLDQEDSFNFRGFVRYDYMPLGHVAVGLEKSWGGLQTLADGSVTTAFGSQALGNKDISKDDYLRGHLQLTMPLAKDLQVGADLHHDFERVGGYKEDFGAEIRFIKFFLPAPPAAPMK